MSVEQIPGSPNCFRLVVDFDLQGLDDGNWVLVSQSKAARAWLTATLEMAADPVFDADGAALAIDMLKEAGDLFFAIDGEVAHD